MVSRREGENDSEVEMLQVLLVKFLRFCSLLGNKLFVFDGLYLDWSICTFLKFKHRVFT